MADKKISQLTGATTPLAGTEVLPIVQSGSTVKVSAADVTAGRAVSAASVAVTGSTVPANGVYLPAANTVAVSTNSTKKFEINSAGNAGLGVAPSAWSSAFGPVLQFASSGSTGGGALTGSSGDNFRIFANTYYDGAYKRTVSGYATQYEHASGDHAWYTAGTGAADSAITWGAAKLTLSNAGNLTVGNGNLVVGTAGKGIDFSANTPSTGSTSQLLNWYEEGTWTPTVEASYGTLNSYTSAGKYTKIGRQVCLQIQVSALNVTGATGIKITNLPFTMAEGTVVGTRENNGAGLAWNWGSSSATTTTIFAWRYDNVTDVANGFAWKFTLTYFV